MKTSVKIGLAAMVPLTVGVVLPATLIPTLNKKNYEAHILSINDFHGAAPGYGDTDFAANKANAGAIRLAQETQEIIKKYPGSLLVSAGDLNAGESFSTVSHAKTFYPVLKAMDIKFSAVGNHAWEWGWSDDEFEAYSKLAKPDDTEGKYFINSNVLIDNTLRDRSWCVDQNNPQFITDYELWESKRLPWADPYKLVDMNGHKVCFIGLTTKDTLKDGNLTSVNKLSFIDYNASVCYSKVKLFADLVMQGKMEDYDKIEAFILDTHCECQPSADGSGIEGETVTLARQLTTKVDAIISAHSHRVCAGKVYNWNIGNKIAVGQAGQAGRNYLDTKLVFNDNNPVGSRLVSVNMEVKTPKIEYGAGGFDKPNPEVAKAQIERIVQNTEFDVVKNTAKVYDEQKQVSLKELKKEIGTLTSSMHYYYTEHTERSFGTQYMQSPKLLEQIGAWTNKAQIIEFNKYYREGWETKKQFYPVSIAMTNLDSLKNGLLLNDQQTTRKVTKGEIFSMHSFENPLHYGTMTVKQLEQYINYILEGACRFDYSSKPGYDKKFYLDDNKTKELVWDKTETVNKDKELGTSYVSGLNQFYGFSFEVNDKYDERVETDPKTKVQTVFKVYTYKEGSLKIYNPQDPTNNIENPESWTPGSNWTANNGLIPFAVASFTWQGGNAQNRMLHHFTEHNALTSPLGGHQMFSKSTRDVALMYIEDLEAEGKPVNQGIDDALIDKLIRNMK